MSLNFVLVLNWLIFGLVNNLNLVSIVVLGFKDVRLDRLEKFKLGLGEKLNWDFLLECIKFILNLFEVILGKFNVVGIFFNLNWFMFF